MKQDEILAYYLTQGAMTDPRDYARLYEDLPADVPSLVKVVQGLMVHIFWARSYQLELSDARQAEVSLRPVPRKLTRILEMDPAQMVQPRQNVVKLVGNCRDFTVLTVSLLRSKGIPARSRCGFGTYFMPDHFEDHWVLEYWNAEEKRWIWVDAQLDDLQQEALKIPFNPLDMPAGAFVTGGEAWQMVQRGEADPDCFGIFEFKGIDFIKGNLLRDLLALNKFEVLPWDSWGPLITPAAEMNPGDLALLDQAALICCSADIPGALAFCKDNPGFIAPAEWAD